MLRTRVLTVMVAAALPPLVITRSPRVPCRIPPRRSGGSGRWGTGGAADGICRARRARPGHSASMTARWDRFVQDFDRSTSRRRAHAPSDREDLRPRLERLGVLLVEAGRRAGEFWDRLDDDERKELGVHVGDLVKRPRDGTKKSSEEWNRLLRIVRKGLGLDEKAPGKGGTRGGELPASSSKRSR